jgi:hypothetical protein
MPDSPPATLDDEPCTADEWNALINEAVGTTDPLLSNFRITRVHYLLSQSLRSAIGPSAGANFHSWAVWGSRKAGITIRQEDKDQASRDATLVAGIVGALVGLGAGWCCSWLTGWSLAASIFAWVAIGIVTGAYCGKLLAGFTRREAARLILDGNRTVLDDIGRLTARYLDYVGQDASGNPDAAWESFLDEFRPGPSEQNGQDLLRRAFEQYEQARQSSDVKQQQECAYFANCLAVLHEHVRLQPYIARSLPFLIRKCVTERLMSYSVGQKLLAVHEDVPPLGEIAFPETLVSIESRPLQEFLNGPDGWDIGRGTLNNTRAQDWTKIRQRMAYIVNLFRTRHLDSEVIASPYSDAQFDAIARGSHPPRPW